MREQVELDGEMVVTLTVRNFGAEPVSGTVSVEAAADFRDMFDTAASCSPSGRAPRAEPTADGVLLSAMAVDQRQVATRIT